MKKKSKIIVRIVIVTILLILVVLTVFLLYKRKERLESYDAMTLTPKGSIMLEEEWYETYWGLKADVQEYKNTSRFITILDKKIKKRPNVRTVCIEVPLEGIDILELEAYIDSHPEITFYTYLEVRPLSYWQNIEQIDMIEVENTYSNISERLVSHTNVLHFEFYNLEWILLNSRNFKESGTINTEVSKVIFHSFTDHLNMYDGSKNLISNGDVLLSNEYENQLVGKTAVVFGDSIWDLNRGSTGVENVMESFSGIEIENLAVSGSCAAMVEGAPDFFVKVANDYAIREQNTSPNYIFIEFGINDYFYQVSLENEEDMFDLQSYGGALRSGIEILRNKFPKTEIILLGPTTILSHENGNLNISGVGNLRDYEHVMEDVAEEFGLRFINNLNTFDLHVNKMSSYLLADQVHLNETGTLAYVRRLLSGICEISEENNVKWYDKYFYIAHACGGIESMNYTNTLEAFEENYALGHRVFEIDFNFTSDDVLVAVHDWSNKSLYSIYGIEREEEDGVPLSSEKFLNLKVNNKYSTMSFQDVIILMRKYPDVYVVLDTKALDEETIRKQYQVITEDIIGYDDLAERIIPQIYNQEMYHIIMEYYSWDTVIYTMYGILDWKPEQVVRFCEEQNIDVVTTFPGRAEESFIQALKEQGQKIYMHTFNTEKEVEEMLKKGANGIYTDDLYPEMN